MSSQAVSIYLVNAENTSNTGEGNPTPKRHLLFKSLDPIWPKWGVSRLTKDTQWFHRKSDAERFIKTGNPVGSINH